MWDLLCTMSIFTLRPVFFHAFMQSFRGPMSIGTECNWLFIDNHASLGSPGCRWFKLLREVVTNTWNYSEVRYQSCICFCSGICLHYDTELSIQKCDLLITVAPHFIRPTEGTPPVTCDTVAGKSFRTLKHDPAWYTTQLFIWWSIALIATNPRWEFAAQ